ncbi:MAG TPA: PQQ-dependent sugar dehydrogenase, partial [Candidatus Nitrosocosmicus sp.]|nr:PQQ-dependent sugar dehydrogenase [Candidatus Nitrosocosmicus sp.]
SLPSTPGPENNCDHITIGPDNNLYPIIGNVMNPSDETKVQTLVQNFANGSSPDGRDGILRITQDGSLVINSTNGDIGMTGKEYPTNLYYAYGIHNGFGLAFDPVTGYLWESETGRYLYNDEINLVVPGFNSGFGVVQCMSTFFRTRPIH